MGSPWLRMGRDFGKMKSRAPGRFLDASGASGMPYKIQKWLPKSRNEKMTDLYSIFYIRLLGPISPGVGSAAWAEPFSISSSDLGYFEVV